MDEHPSDSVQLCNQLPRTTSDRVNDAITHIILSAQMFHGLKSQQLYAIRPILNIKLHGLPGTQTVKNPPAMQETQV